MNTFPTLSSGIINSHTQSPDPKTVSIGQTASGYPVVQKLSTFTPLIFRYTRVSMSTADMQTIKAFYDANMGVPFEWLNTKDGDTYEVIFMQPPQAVVRNRAWGISFVFQQSSPLP